MDEIHIFFLIFDLQVGGNRMIYPNHELKLFYDSNSNRVRLIHRPNIDSIQNWVLILFLKTPDNLCGHDWARCFSPNYDSQEA